MIVGKLGRSLLKQSLRQNHALPVAYPVIENDVQPNSAQFRENKASFMEVSQELVGRVKQIQLGSSAMNSSCLIYH
jgi:hypothetical protein